MVLQPPFPLQVFLPLQPLSPLKHPPKVLQSFWPLHNLFWDETTSKRLIFQSALARRHVIYNEPSADIRAPFGTLFIALAGGAAVRLDGPSTVDLACCFDADWHTPRCRSHHRRGGVVHERRLRVRHRVEFPPAGRIREFRVDDATVLCPPPRRGASLQIPGTRSE